MLLNDRKVRGLFEFVYVRPEVWGRRKGRNLAQIVANGMKKITLVIRLIEVDGLQTGIWLWKHTLRKAFKTGGDDVFVGEPRRAGFERVYPSRKDASD